MVMKRFLISVFLMGSIMFASMCNDAVATPHIVFDGPQNTQVLKDLQQMSLALKQEMEMVNEMQNMNASIGSLKSVPGRLFNSMQNKLKDESGQFIKTSISQPLVKIGLEQAQKDAKKVQQLVTEKVFPKEGEDVTSAEAEERKALRKQVREDAISDAYAVSLAYMAESTKAEQEKIQPAKDTVAQKATLKDKQDGANEVAVARLKEQIEANRLLALQLRLQAANSMADLGAYKDVDS